MNLAYAALFCAFRRDCAGVSVSMSSLLLRPCRSDSPSVPALPVPLHAETGASRQELDNLGPGMRGWASSGRCVPLSLKNGLAMPYAELAFCNFN